MSKMFNSPTVGRLSTERLIREIADFVNSNPKAFYRLVIGTDSQIKRISGKKECDYVTAIVIHRKGEGARYFWRKNRVKAPPVLREKIYTETTISLKAAVELVPDIRDALENAKYELEIHIDVGPSGPTREMIREVVGMVTGSGFVAKTKPQSWGASSVADRYT